MNKIPPERMEAKKEANFNSGSTIGIAALMVIPKMLGITKGDLGVFRGG